MKNRTLNEIRQSKEYQQAKSTKEAIRKCQTEIAQLKTAFNQLKSKK